MKFSNAEFLLIPLIAIALAIANHTTVPTVSSSAYIIAIVVFFFYFVRSVVTTVRGRWRDPGP